MLKRPNYTPRPIEVDWNAHKSPHDDTTGELNYTTEIKAALRCAATRRRRTSILPKLPEPIAEDYNNSAEIRFDRQSKGSAFSRTSLTNSTEQRAANNGLDLSARNDSFQSSIPSGLDGSRICKKPRRRTIYIPSDDTTIATIHPGLGGNSQLRDHTVNQVEAVPPVEMPLSDKVHPIENRRARRTSLAAAPKRGPLRPTLKPLQEMNDNCDLNGNSTGKENIAPDLQLDFKAKAHRPSNFKARRSSIFQSRHEDQQMLCAGIRGQVPAIYENVETHIRSQQHASPPRFFEQGQKDIRRASLMNKRNSIYYGTTWKVPKFAQEGKDKQVACPTISLPISSLQKSTSPKPSYQVIEEDIKRPEMFEEAWLSCQEHAIQQLLNRFFATAAAESARQTSLGQDVFKVRSLDLYQESENAIIFKRLHASLLYGALNPSNESTTMEICRLQTDVGLRRAFLDLWLSSYDLKALIGVIEVVVGRCLSPSWTPNSKLPRDRQEVKKGIAKKARAFIESCLLRNEDVQETISEPPSPTWHWRRTMLRSLMTILLLDRAKEKGLLHRNLFQSTSKFKSSHEVLVELCSLMSPFLGDVTRSLAHLHYHLHHVQHPLSEYEYGISNLATNLRDGIRLTHLVELLFYCHESQVGSPKDTFCAVMPQDNVVSRSWEEARHPWPLSQRLKIPCVSWSQKAYNVQIALSALSGRCGVDEILRGIKAEDIVNGHRERTVTLLWGLVGKWGLERMIDFEEVRREIHRLTGKSVAEVGFEFETNTHPDQVKLAEQTNLLQQWAHSIADLHGLSVTNLTTSFSDGKVFAAIVDEYHRFLPEVCSATNEIWCQVPTKLRNIGCSDAFGNYGFKEIASYGNILMWLIANLFNSSDRRRIFHRDFTLSALAFLCSRLLSASRRGIAASVILGAYRKSKIRQSVGQRLILLNLAHECRSVYLAQNRVVDAARVLQRTWRDYILRKQRCITSEPPRVLLREKKKNVGEQDARKRNSGYQRDIWLP